MRFHRRGTRQLSEPAFDGHTQEYYAALREAQDGGYRPERDAAGWVAFCVDAHLVQAQQRLAQIEKAAGRWAYLEQLIESRNWPERLVIALEQSLTGRTERSRYGEEADVSPATASGDFRRLLDAGLVEQHGRGRTVSYLASDTLRDAVEGASEQG